ncbi:large conductance mechanosensitive channel protein MscL [Lysobacter sp. A03]|uniref:large conductance mechanosensitive channel protein MscL n=1 Tax=Lysobacter sp. A03 TaxID=1199154 RepID=UPI0005B71066|nr:large conductance mechanosensitive channel protein MscL [Lysobacter sp. A03]KIQ97745.1 Large-conductance mechanosensitive channel [Lysobacter sp. A03]
MSMISEFKEFIARGNVVDLAIAVVIGAAFGKIVTALVDGIIMPVVGMAMGGVDFSQLFVSLDGNDYANLALAQEAAAPVITYGAFIQTIIDFLLIALVIFLMLRTYNRMRNTAPPEEEAAAEPTEEVVLLREIRDSLKR